MKIGAAKSLNEVSPEHFRQLSAKAGLGWPLVRARLGELTSKVEEVLQEGALTLHPDAVRFSEPARRIVAARAARMRQLMT